MKPTFEINRPGRSSGSSAQISKRPITDWSFQTSAPVLRGGTTPFHPGVHHVALRPGFHTLSQGFFAREAGRESRFEGAAFGLIVALAAWPIALAMQAALVLIK